MTNASFRNADGSIDYQAALSAGRAAHADAAHNALQRAFQAIGRMRWSAAAAQKTPVEHALPG